MSIFQILGDLIDLRSFSNLWYWIALAVLWSSASHWVMGVPWDMVIRARRRGGEAEGDLLTFTRINARRLDGIRREAGLAMALIVPFLLSFLAFSGFLYGAEISQAIFLMLLPLSLVFWLSLKLARRLSDGAVQMDPAQVIRALSRHRLNIQIIGMVAILITAFWGMFQNLRFVTLQFL